MYAFVVVASVFVTFVSLLSLAGILTVFVEAAVTRPFASTVIYGTLNVAP